jgi:hypothetical protein
MLHTVWNLLASPAAALAVGAVALIFLVVLKRHRELTGKISAPKIVACVLLGAAGYVFFILAFGHFVLNVPASSIIRERIGDDRFAWLLIGVAADTFARLYRIFEAD